MIKIEVGHLLFQRKIRQEKIVYCCIGSSVWNNSVYSNSTGEFWNGMGCQQNLLNGQGLKVNTAAKALPISAATARSGPLRLCMGSSVNFQPLSIQYILLTAHFGHFPTPLPFQNILQQKKFGHSPTTQAIPAKYFSMVFQLIFSAIFSMPKFTSLAE